MAKRKTTKRRTTTKRKTTTKRRTTKTKKRKTTAKRKTTGSWFKGKGKRHHTPYKADSHGGVSWKKKSVGKKCSICSGSHSIASHRHHGPKSHQATRGPKSKYYTGTKHKQYVAYQRKTTGRR